MLNFNLDDNYYCQFLSSKHLLRDPKILPCLKTVCLQCIQSVNKVSNSFYCKFCGDTHDFNDLRANDEFDKNFNKNLKYISILFKNSLKSRLSRLVETTNDNNFSLAELFNSMEYEIDVKVESIKHELTTLKSNLHSSCDFIRENHKICTKEDYVKQLKSLSKDSNFLSFGKNLLRKLDNITEEPKRIVSCKTTSIKMIENTIKNFKEELNCQLNLPSICLDSSIIGKFIDSNLIESLSKNSIKEIDLKTNSKFNNLCALANSQLIAGNNKKDTEIYIFNDRFEIIKKISKISQTDLRPLNIKLPAICTDGQENVYICELERNRVIITDLEFSKIKHIFGSFGNKRDQFDCPIAIDWKYSKLFILDRGNSRVSIFSQDGKFIKNISLYKQENEKSSKVLLNIPRCLSVDDNLIAILNTNNIYLYNFNGRLLYSLNSINAACFCFIQSYFCVYTNDGNLKLFKLDKTTNNYNNCVLTKFHDCMKNKMIQCINYFNGNLVMFETDSSTLILIQVS